MENWHLIAGLGNPGADYEHTRHNAGFMVVDRLAGGWKAAWSYDKKFAARVARVDRGGRKVLLCQPQTFMNASGRAVAGLVDYTKIPITQVLIAVDDADLELGELRLRPSGSSGGHHGLESIEQHLGTRDYARQRFGIGREEHGAREITGHVLSGFRAAEKQLLEKVLQKACEQIECWLSAGIQQAMNQFNGATEV